MADQQERLTAALADRYAIHRELGRGGMATVYLATDLRHLPDASNRLTVVLNWFEELKAKVGN